ncbi:hypothetical protein ANCDUO_09482 [Ancylostoma duodenale]|uniref:Tc1-like transposase DDE domain-containing protein n=1 Tax=Ancylostoma duodenale TaxID=51022 RepID=A0A0C2CTP2_9BILA|nr:hypothetical protein ANCDUO_09482 [Ancylostoma duodenale]
MILENKVLPWALQHFGEEVRIYQQDDAPSHKSEEAHEWIARNFSDFTSVHLSQQRPGHWPANSSNFDPLDYSIRGILESIACAKLHSTVEALKRDLTKAWNNLPMDIIPRAVDEFPRQLRRCTEASSGHFEKHQLERHIVS